jgi:polyhydroxyalkanoate synthesis regulator phasin
MSDDNETPPFIYTREWLPDTTRLDLLITKANIEMGRITIEDALANGDMNEEQAEEFRQYLAQQNAPSDQET